EEQFVPHDRTAERSANLIAVVVLFLVLYGQHRGVIEGAELQPLDRTRGNGVAGKVIVAFAGELVAARLRDRADDAAKRAAVLGLDAARLDLDFLQILEDRVLTGAAVDQAVGIHAVHREAVLRPARAVD